MDGDYLTDGIAHAGSHDGMKCSFEDEGEVAFRLMEDTDKPKR